MAAIADALTTGRERRTPLWAAVDAVVDRAPQLSDLRVHRLQLLALERWRAEGLPVPADLSREAHEEAVRHVTAPVLLRAVRDHAGGPVLVMKGPELAALYRRPELRPFSDVDLLVPDAVATQRELLDAGFVEVGEVEKYTGIHHLRPLHWPSSPVVLEIHSAPKWPRGLQPPAFEELLAAARPSATGISGLLAPSPAHHALIVAAHSWAHEPLARLLHLVDVALLLELTGRDEVRETARRWEIERLWNTTEAAVDSLLAGGRRTVPLRTWARNLGQSREAGVATAHLARTLAPFWALPFPRALLASAAAVRGQLLPEEGETWRDKAARTRKAIRNAGARRSEHDESVAALRRKP